FSYSVFVLVESTSARGHTLSSPTCSSAVSSSDRYTITPSGLTSANYAITFHAGTLTVNKASTTTALASSLNPSTYGDLVTFTATVTVNSPSTLNPSNTGTVSF